MSSSGFKRIMAMVLALSTLMTCLPMSFAAEIGEKEQASYVNFEDVELDDAVRAGDLFYIGSKNMSFSEKGKDKYLLKVGRGGEADIDATLTVKITDVTAKLGENYTVELYDGKAELNMPDDYMSVVEGVTADPGEVVEYVIPGQDELQEMTGEYLEQLDQGENTTQEQKSIYSRDPLAKLKAEVTGVETDRQPMFSEKGIEDLQTQLEDITSQAAEELYGYTMDITFAPGERDKFIVITPKYSSKADGNMQVMVTLQGATEGMGISGLCSETITIIDEDKGAGAKIGFAQSEITADGGNVFVEITRTGAINDMVGISLYSEEGTATGERDFSPVNLSVYFPMGIYRRVIEIPINYLNYNDSEFYLKLGTPLGCEIGGNDTLKVTIPAIGGAIAMRAASNTPLSSESLNLSNLTTYGGATKTSDQNGEKILCTTIGKKDYTMVGVETNFTKTPYHYDGIRVNWALEKRTGWWVSNGYTKVSVNGSERFSTDVSGFVRKDEDIYFNASEARGVSIKEYNTSGVGRNLSIYSITPIKRKFEITLLPANPLSFRGTTVAEAQAYSAAIMDNRSDVSTLSKYSDDQISVKATNSKNYTKLLGLEFVDAKGNAIPINGSGDTLFVKNNETTNNITFKLTSDLTNVIGPHMKTVKGSESGSLIGQFFIRPVFGYYDADLTIKAAKEGYFENFDVKSDTNFPGYHIGDRITFKPALRDEYKFDMGGTGYEFTTQLNLNSIPEEGSLKYYKGSATIELKNEFNEYTPLFSKKNNSVKVSVKKELIDSGKFDLTQGLFLTFGSTKVYNEKTASYEYTVVPEGQVGPGNYPISAVAANSKDVPVWEEYGKDKLYGGSSYFYKAYSEPEKNIIYLSLRTGTPVYYSIEGKVYNPDINLSTGRDHKKPIVPATGSAIFAGGRLEISGLEGEFAVKPFAIMTDMYVKYLIINNGNERIMEEKVPANGPKKNITVTEMDSKGNPVEKTYSTIVTDVGVITVSAQSDSGASFDKIFVEQMGTPIQESTGVAMNGQSTKLMATVRDKVAYKIDDKDFVETVKEVNFIFVDGKLNSQKSSIKAVKGSDGITWTADIPAFSPDKPSEYTYGDLIYVQMVTDKRMLSEYTIRDADGKPVVDDEFKAEPEMVYAPMSTGYQIIAGEVAVSYDLEFNLDTGAAGNMDAKGRAETTGYARLPVLEHFNTLIQTKYFSLTLETLPNNGIRMRFGFQYPVDLSKRDDASGKITEHDYIDEDGEEATITDYTDPESNPGKWYKPWEKYSYIKNWKVANSYGYMDGLWWKLYGGSDKEDVPVKELAKWAKKRFKPVSAYEKSAHNIKGLAQTFGTPQLALTMRVGGYFDFGLVLGDYFLPKKFDVLGAGVYVGGSLQHVLTFYAFPAGVPIFLGTNIDVTAALDAGWKKPEEGSQALDDWHDILRYLNIDLTSIASLKLSAGLGVGKVLAVRAYILGTLGFKLDPFFEYAYPDSDSNWGLLAQMSGGIQLDLAGMEIPIPLTKYIPGWDEAMTYKWGIYDYFAQREPEARGAYSGNEQEPQAEGVQYKLKERAKNAQWVANTAVQPRGGYNPISTQTLMKDGYNQADSKIINMGGGKMLMVFLADDLEKSGTEITELMYSVYENGIWGDPVTVQPDATGDFYPNLCDVGGDIMISWASADPSKITLDESASPEKAKLESMKAMDVYTVLFDKNGKTLGEVERITDDDYFDSQPMGVYDALTGERAVYYLKTSTESEELIDYANAAGVGTGETVYTVMCYMIYADPGDGKGSRWLKDYVFDNEANSQEDKDTIINDFGGQRFLSSAVDGIKDPIIADTCVATGYNGVAVFAFTVDMDNNVDTYNDRDLFVQVFDFETHKLYHPIRITNDKVSQAQPQLVRQGSGDTGKTYLFWMNDQKDVTYINATDLIRDVEADGSLPKDYKITSHTVETKAENGQGVAAYFSMVDDNDNLYVLWPQGVVSPDENGDMHDENGKDSSKYSQEIFATALIEDEAGKAAAAANEAIDGVNWSKPYRLTREGAFNDGVAAAIDDSGNLVLVYNQFKQVITGNGERPIEIKDVKLVSTILQPVGTLSLETLKVTTGTPQVGDEVTFKASLINDGLTTASGYTTEFFIKDGEKLESIARFERDERVITNTVSQEMEFNYKVEEGFDKLSMVCVIQEKGYGNVIEREFKPFKKTPVYSVSIDSLKQVGEEYEARYTVKNVGNAPAGQDDKMLIYFGGPYGDINAYGISETIFAEQSVSGLGIGDEKTYTSKLDIEQKAFDYSGYIECDFTVYDMAKDKDGDEKREPKSANMFKWLYMDDPINVKVNGSANTIYMTVGQKLDLKATYDLNKHQKAPLEVEYACENGKVAALNGSTLTALGTGTTTLKVYLRPYGTEKEITVSVNSESFGGDDIDSPKSHQIGATQAEGGKISPSSATVRQGASQTFTIIPNYGYEIEDVIVNGNRVGPVTSYTFTNVTASGTITAKFKKAAPETIEWDNPFSDVFQSDWFYRVVATVNKLGVMNGIAQDKFAPKDYLTRGMFVTMLARYDGAQLQSNPETGFSDVAGTSYCAGAVLWASTNNIASGISKTEFKPDDFITREQIITIMHRYAKFKGYDVSNGENNNILSYDDFTEISQFAISAAQWALADGIISGRTISTVNPLEYTTRGEAAQIIVNFMAFQEKHSK